MRPGARVFVEPGAGEPQALLAALAGAPDASAEVHYVFPVVPGVNRTDLSALHDSARMTCFFAPRPFHAGIAAGRIRHLPLHLRAVHDYLGHGRRYDVALIQLAPPDAHGRCSLGVTGAFEAQVLARADTVVAEINPRLPTSPGAPSLPLAQLDYAVEVDHGLLEFPNAAPNPALAALARAVATLIEDGDTVETGIGTAPSAILEALGTRRDLGIHSGLITDAVAALVEAGWSPVRGNRSTGAASVTGLAIGTGDSIAFSPQAGRSISDPSPTPTTRPCLPGSRISAPSTR